MTFISMPVQIKIAWRNILKHPVKNGLIGFIMILSCMLFFLTDSLSDNTRSSWREFLSSTIMGDYHVSTAHGLAIDYSVPFMKLPGKFVPKEVVDYLDARSFMGERV